MDRSLAYALCKCRSGVEGGMTPDLGARRDNEAFTFCDRQVGTAKSV